MSLSAGLAAPIGGVCLLVWMKRLASHRVTVFENGFLYEYRGTTEIIPWIEVEKIDEVFTKERLPIAKIPGAVLRNTDRSFVVRRKDSKEFRFTVNTINNISRLAKCLEEARAKHGIAWERIER